MRFRDIAKEIHAAKGGMSESCAGAFFSLTAAQYAAGKDFKATVLEGNFAARLRVHGHTDNVAGVKIPVFKPYDAGDAAGAGGGAAAGAGGGALDKLGLDKVRARARSLFFSSSSDDDDDDDDDDY